MQTTAASHPAPLVRTGTGGIAFHRKVLLVAAVAMAALSLGWALGASALLDFYLTREPDPALAARVERVGTAVLWGGLAAVIALTILGAILLERLVTRWISGPARELATAVEAVAAGDLSGTVREGGVDEIGRLSRATGTMVAELRRLAGALGTSSSDTTRLAAEISAAAEQLAAGAGEMATTAGELSEQSTVMASGIAAITEASDRLSKVAAELDRGAREAAGRNRELRELSLENRARLDESSRVLGELSNEASKGVAAVESLVIASEEIRTFVTLVRKLARQSKLLALNAAMEAARAGDEGEGFAVVANEVRRLAAMSSDAAERTEIVVSTVLAQVEDTRRWSRRTEETVREVSTVTATGARSFERIEATVGALDVWAGTIEGSAATAHQLTQEITRQLGSLSLGTDTFASAMEEVAASSEEQSAATQEVAAAAAHLSAAAERLAGVVGHFKLDAGASAVARRPSAAETETASTVDRRPSAAETSNTSAVDRRPSAAETPLRAPVPAT